MSKHPWIETEESSHILLRLYRGVELHDEVVALTVLGLVFCGRTREVELAPVLQAADDAVGGEDLRAGNSSDLFDIVQIARQDLQCLSEWV